MPIHNWTRVDAGLFHHFHQRWSVALCDALNDGVLPTEHFALVEQNVCGPIADVLTLRLSDDDYSGPANAASPISVLTLPPKARVVNRSEADIYAERANIVAVRHRHGKTVAIIEIVSPGNKSSRDALRAFAEKSAELLRQHVHLLVVDLFPPSKRDPQGIHKAIWDEIQEEDFTLPADKPLTVAGYNAGPGERVAYVEPVGVGDALPEMPIFLTNTTYINAPLEKTYNSAWEVFPLKKLLEGSQTNGRQS